MKCSTGIHPNPNSWFGTRSHSIWFFLFCEPLQRCIFLKRGFHRLRDVPPTCTTTNTGRASAARAAPSRPSVAPRHFVANRRWLQSVLNPPPKHGARHHLSFYSQRKFDSRGRFTIGPQSSAEANKSQKGGSPPDFHWNPGQDNGGGYQINDARINTLKRKKHANH